MADKTAILHPCLYPHSCSTYSFAGDGGSVSVPAVYSARHDSIYLPVYCRAEAVRTDDSADPGAALHYVFGSRTGDRSVLWQVYGAVCRQCVGVGEDCLLTFIQLVIVYITWI
jgi:hypothetical protein